MTRLLAVAGGSGNLGRALSAEALRRTARASDPRVLPLDRRSADLLLPEAALLEDLRRLAAPGTVLVNCAALTDVSRCERNPWASRAVNSAGAGRLARVARQLRVPLVHVSTDYVFGGPGAPGGPYSPADRPRPGTRYGSDKAAGEAEVLSAGGWVVRMSFLPAPFEHARVFSGVLCCKEWVEDAAARLLDFCSALDPVREAARVVHLVGPETELSALVRSRYPEVPAVPVGEGASGLPFSYPLDVRLSGAWSR